jgi:hypothetical protein
MLGAAKAFKKGPIGAISLLKGLKLSSVIFNQSRYFKLSSFCRWVSNSIRESWNSIQKSNVC